jgi:hypothetical protein
MPEKAERLRRKAITRVLAASKRAEAERKLPMSLVQLHGLCSALDQALIEGCDHSLRFTNEYLRTNQLSSEKVVPWLHENGGFCDCEVLANVGDEWGSL